MPQAEPVQAAAPEPPAVAVALDAALTELIREVNRAGGRMPEGGVPAVREVEDVLRPLLRYLKNTPASETEMIGVRALVLDYLPTTVRKYLALPPHFVDSHRNEAGRTATEEFLEQLKLMAQAAADYATAIYVGDAEDLSSQGRFLASRFAPSELEL